MSYCNKCGRDHSTEPHSRVGAPFLRPGAVQMMRPTPQTMPRGGPNVFVVPDSVRSLPLLGKVCVAMHSVDDHGGPSAIILVQLAPPPGPGQIPIEMLTDFSTGMRGIVVGHLGFASGMTSRPYADSNIPLGTRVMVRAAPGPGFVY